MNQKRTEQAYSPIFNSAKAEATFLAAYDKAMTLWPVPYEQRDVPTRFGRTHVVVSGPENGPPIVLLHCALMTSAIWSPIIGELSATYRTLRHRCDGRRRSYGSDKTTDKRGRSGRLVGNCF